MKKILLLVLLAAGFALGADTTGTRNAAAAGRIDSLAGYSWSPATPSGFTGNVNLIFDGTSVQNATLGAAMHVKQITARVAYTGAWSTSTFACTTDAACSLGTGGAITIGGILAINNATSTMSIGCSGTLSATNAVLAFLGLNDTLHLHKATTIAQLHHANTAYLDGSDLTITGSQPLVDDAGTLKFYQNGTVIINTSNGGTAYTSGAVMTGPNVTLYWRGASAGASISIPAVTWTGYYWILSASTATTIFNITGVCNLNGNVQEKSDGQTISVNYGNNDYNPNGSFWAIGPQGLTGHYTWGSGGGVTTISGYYRGDLDQGGTITRNFGNRIFRVLGGAAGTGWNNGAYTNFTDTVGTSEHRFVGANTPTITSTKGKFYLITDSLTAGANYVVQADSISAQKIKIWRGGWRATTFNMHLQDTLFLNGADSISLTSGNINFMQYGTLIQKNTGARRFRASTLNFLNGGQLLLDSSLTWYAIKIGTVGKGLAFPAGKTTTDSVLVAGDWSGSVGNIDTIKSTQAGTAARIKVPQITAPTYLYIKDNYAQGFQMFDTLGGVNGGNDSGWIFKTPNGMLYNTPSVVTVTSCSPLTGPAAGGFRDTITGTGFYDPCSISVDGVTFYPVNGQLDSTKLYITSMPAHAAGAVTVTVHNGSPGIVGSKATALTYVAAPILAYRTSPLSATVGSPITPDTCLSTGGATDSLVFRHGLAVGGLSYSKITGRISGTPTTVQTVTDTLDGFQFGASAGTATISITVASGCAPASVTYAAATDTTYKGPYAHTPIIASGTFDSVWILPGDSLRYPLAISKTTGVITGSPRGVAAATTVRVVFRTPSGPCYDTATFAITIAAPVRIISVTPNHADTGTGQGVTIAGYSLGATHGTVYSDTGSHAATFNNAHTDSTSAWVMPVFSGAARTIKYWYKSTAGDSATFNWRVTVPSSGIRRRGMGLGIGLSFADQPRGAFRGAAWR